jgi:hypothetical protein
VAGEAEFDELVRILGEVLQEAWERIDRAPQRPPEQVRRAP